MKEYAKLGINPELLDSSRRVALVTNANLKEVGGQAISIKNMLGFPADWTVVSPFPNSDLEGVHVMQTKRDVVIPGKKQHVVSPLEMRGVNKELKTQDPQAIILDGRSAYPLSFYAGLTPDLREKTYAMWRYIINDPSGRDTISPARRVLQPLKRDVMRRFASGVKANLAVSEVVAQSLRDLGVPDNKIIVVPENIGNEFTPADRIRDKELSYEEKNRAEFLEEDELGILYTGRIIQPKGIDWIADLYKELRQGHTPEHLTQEGFKKIKITLAGPVAENDQPYFNSFVKNLVNVNSKTKNNSGANDIRINYVGSKMPEQLQKLYNAYDIFFMPSFSEGFGRTTVEAMMGGMTVIGREQTAATKQILSEAPYPIGLLVNSGEHAAREVLALMKNPEELAEMQGNALRWSSSHYSIEESRRRLWAALDR